MRSTILIFFLLSLLKLSGPCFAQTDSPSQPFIGDWKWVLMHYQNHFLPPPNPNLILTYHFYPDGTDRLFWTYKNDLGVFCERKGNFTIDDGNIVDTIYWVNPDNAIECSRDPDMQLGKTTITPAKIIEGQLHLFLQFGNNHSLYLEKNFRSKAIR